MSAKKLGEPREGSEESKENSVGFSLTKIKQISKIGACSVATQP